MSDFDPQQVVFDVFNRLRRSGLSLGISELLAALQAIEGGWGSDDPQSLRQVTRLLWCASAMENPEFEMVWEETIAWLAGSEKRGEQQPEETPQPELHGPLSDVRPPTTKPPATENERTRQPPARLDALPVQAPFMPAPVRDVPHFFSYSPVSRRSMGYAWRYLRRPIADGPEETLDVNATVDQVARQGFYLAPVYRRRERNYAHLLLLLDQGGSMAPFHRLTRDIAETAQYESTIETVDVYHFHNVPSEAVFLDPKRTQRVDLERVLVQCADTTSVLIVSDAGAARGYQTSEARFRRGRETGRFIARLKRQTSLIAWLNPTPNDRWSGTSAQIVSHLAPMFEMDAAGFGYAVDALRGLTPSGAR